MCYRSLFRRVDVAAKAMNPALVLIALGLALTDVAVLGARDRVAMGGSAAWAQSRGHTPDGIYPPAAILPQPGRMVGGDGRD